MNSIIAVIIGIIAGILGIILAVWMALWAIGLLKKGFQRSEPKPGSKQLSKKELKRLLLRLNNKHNPFRIQEAEETDLIAVWDIVDAKWIEILGKAWLKKRYTAYFLLDETTKTVKCNEMIKENSSTAGPTGIHFEKSFFRGIQLWRKEQAYRWGIRDDFTIGEIYNYKFDPANVKDIVRQIANDHGWAFTLVTTRGQVLKR